MNINNYVLFENCVAQIFREAEYSIQQNMTINNRRDEIDILAEKNGEKYCIEVKYALVNDCAAERITQIAQNNKMLPILVIAEYIKKRKREYYHEKYPELIVIDITNLLFAVRSNDELKNLNYSTENIEPAKGFIEINSLQHNSYTQSLIREMELCKKGKEMARDYEVLCHKLLENLFSNDLTLWKEQKKSNKDFI